MLSVNLRDEGHHSPAALMILIGWMRGSLGKRFSFRLALAPCGCALRVALVPLHRAAHTAVKGPRVAIENPSICQRCQ
jgi:hypothetical protein